MPTNMLTLNYNKGKSSFDTISNSVFYYDFYSRNSMTVTRQYFKGLYLDVNRCLYRYDKGNRLICNVTQINNNGKYDNSDRDTCTYDEKGNQTIYMQQVFENNKWHTLKGTKNIFTYDGNHVSTQITQFADTSGKWVNDIKYVYSTDSHGDINEAIVYQWSDSAAVWSEFVKLSNLSLSANDINRPVTYTVQFRIGSNYLNAQRVTFTYNKDGLVTSSLTENYKNNKWVNNTKEQYSYDFLDNKGFYSYQQWDVDKSAWVIQSQTQNQFTYDGEKVISNQFSVYNVQSQSWEIINKLVYYYTNFTSIESKIDNTPAGFKLYPNPARDVLNINLPDNKATYKACVTDISGKVVMVQLLDASTTAQINIGPLRPGCYFITVSNKENTYSSRIVKN